MTDNAEQNNNRPNRRRDSSLGWKRSDNVKSIIRELLVELNINHNYKIYEYPEDSILNMNSGNLYFSELPAFDSMNRLHLYNSEPFLNFPDLNSISDDNLELHEDILFCDYEKYNGYTLSKIFCVFTIGVKNVYLSCIDTHSTIHIFIQTVQLLWKTLGSRNKTIDILKKYILLADELLKRYNSIDQNPNDIQKDIVSSVLLRLLKNQNVNIKEKKQFLDFFKYAMTNMFPNSLNSLHYSYLTIQNNIYKRALSTIFMTKNRLTADSYQRGLSLGMKFFSVLEKAGYVFNEDKNYWYKDVNIIPTLCYKDYKLWKILPECQIYKITKLIIDPKKFSELNNDFNIKATGTHPNVDFDNVCLGDLNSKWTLILSSFTNQSDNCLDLVYNFLLDIEETLEIINFDSSFFTLPNLYDCIKPATRDLSNKKNKRGDVKRKWMELD